MADSAKAARGTDDRRRRVDDPVLQGGQVRVNDGQSAARKPDLNRSLTTKPECERSHSQY